MEFATEITVFLTAVGVPAIFAMALLTQWHHRQTGIYLYQKAIAGALLLPVAGFAVLGVLYISFLVTMLAMYS